MPKGGRDPAVRTGTASTRSGVAARPKGKDEPKLPQLVNLSTAGGPPKPLKGKGETGQGVSKAAGNQIAQTQYAASQAASATPGPSAPGRTPTQSLGGARNLDPNRARRAKRTPQRINQSRSVTVGA